MITPIVAEEKKLRTGYTTGSSATAASKAALLSIIKQQKIEEIEITLPKKTTIKIPVNSCQFEKNKAKCSVIKDGGDDPDVTHGAEIIVELTFNDNRNQIEIDGGEGVGIVTKPGLGLEINKPAINPVPKKMITENLQEIGSDILNEKGIPGSTGGEGDFSREEKESELLDQLLSTMEVDEDELDVEAVDFSALLEEVRSDIFAAAGGKAPEWSVGSIPNIQSDSFFLKKSLFFLLNECTESCNRKGSGTIQIQSKASEGSGFLLEIQDNGYREPGSTTNTYKLLVGEKPWLDPGDHGYPWIETREELDKIGIHVKSYKCSAEGLNLELAVPMECPVI